MNKSFKKKLSAAVLAGCSVIAVGSIGFANSSDNMPPPPPPRHAVMQDFDSRPMPPGPEHRQYKAQYEEYRSQLQGKYSWMSEGTSKRAAMNFVSVDKALADNKLSENQAEKLKKELISFYRDRENYISEMKNLDRDERRAYHDRHREHMSLSDNIGKIAQDSNIPAATVERVLRPHGDAFDKRDRMKRPGPPHMRMEERAGEVKQRFENFTNELIADGKLTREEADSISRYMEENHKKFMEMNEDERSAYLEKVRGMSKEERLNAISSDIGISADRLKAIFDVAKDKMESERVK